MQKFLSLAFWFQTQPDLTDYFVSSLFIIATIFLGVFIIARSGKKQKNIFRNAYNSLMVYALVNFFIFAFWWFFALESVAVLSTRIWYVIFAVEIIFWGRAVYAKFTLVPEKRQESAQKRINKKYIP